MREFVARNVDVAGEILEDHIVSIAKGHPKAVPESVIEAGTKVDIRVQVEAKVVDRIPSQDVAIEFERGSQGVIGEIRILLGDRGIALVPHIDNIKVPLVLVVVNEARMRLWRRIVTCGPPQPPDLGAGDAGCGEINDASALCRRFCRKASEV